MNPLALLESVMALVSKLPPEGLALLQKLVSAILTSKDPMRAVRLATMAAASKTATEAGIREALKRLK